MSEEIGYVNSEYLAHLAALLENTKRASYQRGHVTEGKRVLDVGCSPGTDTIPLAELVGASGRVFGIDRNPEMIAQANERAIEHGVAAWTEHRVGDSAKLPFDEA